MNIFYGLDNILIDEAVNKFISTETKNNVSNISSYYLDQESINETINQILNEASTIDLFNYHKIIIINDYSSLLLFISNKEEILNFFQQLKKFNNTIIIKLLTNDITLFPLSKSINFNLIKSYNGKELKKWIIDKSNKYQLLINNEIIDSIIKLFPNNLSIIDNELKKMKNLNKLVTLKNFEMNSYKYFSITLYKLSDYLLSNDYKKFWSNYISYWQNNNYDKYNIFSLLLIQLEIVRNIKILLKKDFNENEITKKLGISLIQFKFFLKYEFTIKKINYLLIQGYDIDLKIKSGKCNKNITIDLFFLQI